MRKEPAGSGYNRFCCFNKTLVELRGIEPLTSSLRMISLGQ